MNEKFLSALEVAYTLKHCHRAGWLRKGIDSPESVAAHSWGMSFLVLNLLPATMNRSLALSYATLHDVAEAITGDLTPHDGFDRREKLKNERVAMQRICRGLPQGHALLELWEAYERQDDPEAKFVRQLDKLDMAIQAKIYSDNFNGSFVEFIDSARSGIIDERIESLLNTIDTLMTTENETNH